MCRGANLGVCCALGCDNRIRCQDTGGYCDEHDPNPIFWDDDRGEFEYEPRPPIKDDPQKRRTYSLARLTERIRSTQTAISQKQHDLKMMQRRYAQLQKEVRRDGVR